MNRTEYTTLNAIRIAFLRSPKSGLSMRRACHMPMPNLAIYEIQFCVWAKTGCKSFRAPRSNTQLELQSLHFELLDRVAGSKSNFGLLSIRKNFENEDNKPDVRRRISERLGKVH